MYRRVNSGRFIGVTTGLIVIVMAVFTWVMYGMAQQVFTMTDVMVDLNRSFKAMVVTQESMARDMHEMSLSMVAMNENIGNMTTSVDKMTDSVSSMNSDIGQIAGSMAVMTGAMQSLTVNMNRMTMDVGRATYAFSNPMSYMWGNPFPF